MLSNLMSAMGIKWDTENDDDSGTLLEERYQEQEMEMFETDPNEQLYTFMQTQLEKIGQREQTYFNLINTETPGLSRPMAPEIEWRLWTLNGAAEYGKQEEEKQSEGPTAEQIVADKAIELTLAQAGIENITQATDLPVFSQFGAMALLNNDCENVTTVFLQLVAPGAWLWAIAVEGSEEPRNLVVAQVSSPLAQFAFDLARTAVHADDVKIGRLLPTEISLFQRDLFLSSVLSRTTDVYQEMGILAEDTYTAETRAKLDSAARIYTQVPNPRLKRLVDAFMAPMTRAYNKRFSKKRSEQSEASDDFSPEHSIQMEPLIAAEEEAAAAAAAADEPVQYVWIQYPGIVRLYELYTSCHEGSLTEIMEKIETAATDEKDDPEVASRVFSRAVKCINDNHESTLRRNSLRSRLEAETRQFVDSLVLHLSIVQANEHSSAADVDQSVDVFRKNHEWFMQKMKLRQEGDHLLHTCAPTLARMYAYQQAIAATYDRGLPTPNNSHSQLNLTHQYLNGTSKPGHLEMR